MMAFDDIFNRSARIKRMNRYLEYQGRRLERTIERGELSKACIIWCIIAKQSLAYQIYLYNKVKKEWFWKSDRFTMGSELMQCVNHMRKWSMRSQINRYYIPKKDGRMRPIGAPNITTKVLHRFLADMFRATLEPTRRKNANHAFRRNKGVHTAILNILREFKKDRTAKVYEFDLKSFFNNVPWSWIQHYVKTQLDKNMSNLIISVLKNTRYRFDKLLEEKELAIVEERVKKNGKKVPCIYRNGMTQGSPLSPIIATTVLECWEYPEGLTMYADDGIYIGKELQPIYDWLNKLLVIGINTESTKTREIEYREFKFLGFTIDLEKGWISREDLGQIKWTECSEKTIEEWLKKGRGLYAPRKEEINKRWEWEIAENSQASYAVKSLMDNPKDGLITHFKGLFMLEHKKHKWIPQHGVLEFMNVSSESIAWLAEYAANSQALFEKARLKPLKFPDWLKTKWKEVSRKEYYEINPTNDVTIFEFPDGRKEIFGMPKAALLMEEKYDWVGNWNKNKESLQKRGIEISEELIKNYQ
jgi:hypothetical protein